MRKSLTGLTCLALAGALHAPGAVAVVPPPVPPPVDRAPIEPYADEHMWWSGSGDDVAHTLTRRFDLEDVGHASISMKARWDTQAGHDFVYVEASTDSGASWTALDGTVDGVAFGEDGEGRPALHGRQKGWADVEVPLDPVLGGRVQVRLAYRTDGETTGAGFFADELAITVDGETHTDGAEMGTMWWKADGFEIITGTG